MRKVTVFNNVSLDGFFTDAHNDLSWAHQGNQDEEWSTFVGGNASGRGALLLGRITFDQMASFWPTAQGRAFNPAVAEGMTKLQKIVFSTTLKRVSWENTTLLNGDVAAQVKALKREAGSDIVVLGSGSIVSPLAQAGLIDEYQFVVVPVILGQGRTMFEGVTKKLSLQLKSSRAFGNGNVVLSYSPGM